VTPGVALCATLTPMTGAENRMDDTPPEVGVPQCTAELYGCDCGLAEHPVDVAHECDEPDPQCGGSWLDHPTDPSKVLVVRWPGIRPGGINEARAKAAGIVDPPDGEPVEHDRYYTFRVARGPIKYIPVISVGEVGQ
jgi:hypothetical protein